MADARVDGGDRAAQAAASWRTQSAEETHRLGLRLGRQLQPGDFIALHGGLGAGKTCLVKGIGEGLGIDPSTVTSPTFTLVHSYEGRLVLLHADAYRLEGPEAWTDLDVEDLAARLQGAIVVEWADRLGAERPNARLDVHIRPRGAQEREIEVQAFGRRPVALLAAWQDEEASSSCVSSDS